MDLDIKRFKKTSVKCGWCNEGFEYKVTLDSQASNEINRGRSLLFCPHCKRLIPSSKKESTGELVGKKHTHREWKDGDLII